MNANDRAITSLVMVAHGLVHTYELAIPIFLPIWLAEFGVIDMGPVQLAVTGATLGAMVTVGYALFGLGALPAGVLVDRLGSRGLITGCLLGMGGAYLLLGLAPGAATVGVALVVWGAAASVYHPAGLSLLSKGVRDRGTGFAYHGIAGNLGIGLGPLFTAVLLLGFDWGTVAMALAVPALLAAVYAARADFDETAAVAVEVAPDGGDPDDGPPGGPPDAGGPDGEDPVGDDAADGVDPEGSVRSVAMALFGGGFALVFLVVVCSGLYYRGTLTFLPELLAGLPGFEPVPLADVLPGPIRDLLGVEGGGRTVQPERYFYAGLLTVGVVGQYVGGKLTDRIRLERGLAAAFALLTVLALLFIPVARLGVAPLVGLGALLGASLFVVQPMYQATVAEYTPADTRGLSYGFVYLGVFGVGALGATLAGAVLTYASPSALFGVLAVVAAVAATAAAYLARR